MSYTKKRNLVFDLVKEGKTDDEIVRMLGEQATKTRQRHAHEKDEHIGKRLQISRETIRKVRYINHAVSAGNAQAKAVVERLKREEISIDAAYRKLIGDKRVGIHANVDPDLRQRLRNEAFIRDVSMTELVAQILDEHLPK